MYNTGLPILAIYKDYSFQQVDLEQSRKYIRIRINNVVKTYDSDGKMDRKNNYFEL